MSSPYLDAARSLTYAAIVLFPVFFPLLAQAATPAEPTASSRPSPVAVVMRPAHGLAAGQVTVESWRFSVACTFPAVPLTPSATLGGPLPLVAIEPRPGCIAPLVRSSSTPPVDRTVVPRDLSRAERNALPSSAAAPDKDLRTPTVTEPPARMILRDTDGCSPSRACDPFLASAVERPTAREMQPSEPHPTLPVPKASAHPGAHLLPWLGLWLVLWLTLMGLFSLGVWVFYKRRLAPEARLVRAAEAGLRRGEFRLEYQPVMSLREGTCVGVEAMIRWTNTEYGLKGPTYYMRILEKTRLIARLTRFVLSTAA